MHGTCFLHLELEFHLGLEGPTMELEILHLKIELHLQFGHWIEDYAC